jgi:uncharacterized protein (DUF1499 family)
MQVVVIIAVAVGIGLTITIALQVDDWRRDLTTNVAETSEDAADPALRPIKTSLGTDDVVELVEQVAGTLDGWKLEAEDRTAESAPLRFVRTTRLFRFKDDVSVRIMDKGEARVVTAVSRSRVGKGDLGQNPRNLRELLGRLRHSLEQHPT